MSLHEAVYGHGTPRDCDPDLAGYMYPDCECHLDHFWPHPHMSLIVHSCLFSQQVFMPERDCSRGYDRLGSYIHGADTVVGEDTVKS